MINNYLLILMETGLNNEGQNLKNTTNKLTSAHSHHQITIVVLS